MPKSTLPPPALVEEELVRLCESDALRRSPSHMRLLRYLVAKGVARDEPALRETSIALEVFRRDPATYDPQTDPIVRVTASRLRHRLEAHYDAFESPPKVRIVLPKGRYVPAFIAVADDARAPEGLAVMATRNATGDPEYDVFCAAFAEGVADGLANLGVPRVIARDSVERARARTSAAADVGRELAVEWLLDSVLAVDANGELRITLRLIAVLDAGVRWIETAAREPAARFAMRDAVADRVYARFAAVLAGAGHGPHPHDDVRMPMQARASLDLARFLLRQRSPDSVALALSHAETLTAVHPESAAAWALLAEVRHAERCFMDRDFVRLHEDALAAARRAIELDPDEASAGVVEASIVGQFGCDPEAGIRRLRKLLRRVPHHSDARCSLAALMQYVGAFDDALAELSIARAHDPLSPFPRAHAANVLAYARRHDEARDEWKLASAAGAPRLTTEVLRGMNELWAGQHARARAHFESAAAGFPTSAMPAVCGAMVDAASGDWKRANATIADCVARFPRVSSYNRAEAAGLARRKADVLRHLRAAHAAHDALLVSACADPSFDWLGSDAEFNDLLRSWGLPGWRGAPSPARQGSVGARRKARTGSAA
jgi:TolB-like protein